MTFSLQGIAPGSDATLPFAAHYEMLRIIKHFACGQLNEDSYAGTGNGLIKRLSVMADNAPEEVWTLTATSATNFTVSGSTSGAQADATVDTFYDNGLISFIILSGGTAFVASDAFVLSSTNGVRTLYQTNYVGTGNGKLTKMRLLDKVSEVWTLTCTTAATDGGTFSVVGSVSGAQADATVGVDYDNGIIQLLINDSTTDFAVNDVFTLTANTQELPLADRWEVLRYDDTSDDHELIMIGNGMVGFGPARAGLKTIQDVGGDYYNLGFSCMDGYTSSNPYETQPHIEHRTMPLWPVDIPYKLRVTQRDINLAVDLGGLGDNAAAGLYLSHYIPGLYPHPVYVMGSLSGLSTTRHDDTVRKFGVDQGVRILWLDGNYVTPEVLPYGARFWDVDNEVIEPTDTSEVTNYVGTGDGTLDNPRKTAAAPRETWSIVATSATTFSVTGSISGSQAAATVDVQYDNGICVFTINDGATPFVIGDEFTLVFDREHALEKVVLVDSNISFGELEAVHFISGFAVTTLDTVVDENTEEHYIFSSINRSGFLDYATLILD